MKYNPFTFLKKLIKKQVEEAKSKRYEKELILAEEAKLIELAKEFVIEEKNIIYKICCPRCGSDNVHNYHGKRHDDHGYGRFFDTTSNKCDDCGHECNMV